MKFDSDTFFTRYRLAFGPLGPYQFSGLTSMLAEADPAFTSVRQLGYAFTTVQRDLDKERMRLAANPEAESVR